MHDDFETATPCSEPKPMLRFGLPNRFDHFGPAGTRQISRREKIFASAGGWNGRTRVTKTITSLAVSVLRIALTRQLRVS